MFLATVVRLFLKLACIAGFGVAGPAGLDAVFAPV